MVKDAAAGPSSAHHSLSHVNPVHSLLLPTLPISITVLLRKKKLEIRCPALEEPLGDFQTSLGNFYPAHKYQTEELCSTAASLPDSSQQGWQLPAGKRNPLPGTSSQLAAAAAVLREICPSTASTNLCTFAGVTNLLQMTSGKAKASP